MALVDQLSKSQKGQFKKIWLDTNISYAEKLNKIREVLNLTCGDETIRNIRVALGLPSHRPFFRNLTKEDKAWIKQTFYDKSITYNERLDIIKERFNLASRRGVRKWCQKLNLSRTDHSDQYEEAKKRNTNKKKYYIITSAQNNTPIHERFWSNIKAYANKIDAEIHVIATRYKNPTSVFTDKKHDSWDNRVLSFLDAGRHNIHPYLQIMSDIKIQPTAVTPLSGLEGLSGIQSCIFGHPKAHFKPLAVLEGYPTKQMFTTGSVTVQNYTDSKAGKKGEFHHTLGFVIVEIIDDKTFLARHVTAKEDGNFIDYTNEVVFSGQKEYLKFQSKTEEIEWKKANNWRKSNPEPPYVWKGKSTLKKINSIEGIVMGDKHYDSVDADVLNATHDFMDKLTPKRVVLHDVFDAYSMSHHHEKDPFLLYYKEVHNKNNLKEELDDMMRRLSYYQKFEEVIICRSNHDEHLDKWLKTGDWKKQSTMKNSRLYMKLSDMLLEQYEKGLEHVIGVIPALIKEKFPKYNCLNRNESYSIKDIEVSLHGDEGANGTRGTANQFKRLNVKTITAHTHSPFWIDGAMGVGTTTVLRMGYNSGASSWSNTHAIIHNNGKRQHVFLPRDKNGKVICSTLL